MKKNLKRNNTMFDKISMISLVWMCMVGAMLTATVSLYGENGTAIAKAGVTEVTARSYKLSQY